MGDCTTAEQVIGVAIIGIGRIGKVHASNVSALPKVRLLYIVDVYKEAAEQYIADYGLMAKALHNNDVDVALNDERVHAVIVCCPTQWHETHVVAALQKGKSVMCEKPLALTLESIVSCYQTAYAQKQTLFCAFNKRFDPQLSHVKSRVPDVVGKIKVVKTVSRDHPRNSIEYLKISGGILLDMCIHDVDCLRWITGQNPESIYVMGHAHFDDIKEINDYDQIFINMKFPDGCLGHVDANREASYGHDQRTEVFGDKGMASSENIRPISSTTHSPSGASITPIYNSCMSRYNESYRQEVVHFINVVRGEESLKVVGRDAIWTTLCCHAANESLITGIPVRLQDFTSKHFPHILSAIEQWPTSKKN